MHVGKSVMMRKPIAVLSVFFLAAAVTSLGLGSYFTVLYLKRAENHRFEAAYVFDQSFTDVVDINLGCIAPGEEVVQYLPIQNLLKKNVRVEIDITGKETSLDDYLSVQFSTDFVYTLKEYYEGGHTFVFGLTPYEQLDLKIIYTLADYEQIEMGVNIDFSLNIRAHD